ncbi:MAG TPA: DUF4062 domain-containing protein, partial [Chloroflexia bacterium]|nr:DUF4062 domain-containing protein [Chloroflexia bacterium]
MASNDTKHGEQAQSPQNILTADQRVRVFVSSTLHELADERKAVREAITDLRLHPVMFEPEARPYPPRDVYRALLEQSHVFIGIYWNQYGWVDKPTMTISGIEDEYNLSENKPRLIYIKQPASGRDPRLEDLIKRIGAEGGLTYSRFSTADELKERIKNDLAQLLSEQFLLAVDASPGAAPLPSYLATLQEDMSSKNLVPRDDLVQQIQAQLVAQGRLLIVGAPGIGKTYLLGMLGAQLDAVYVSLRNRSTQQVFSNLANHLMVKRGQVPRNLPSEEEARLALQTELARSSSVLLIDDVDQNPTTALALMGLDPYDTRLLFAARNVADGDFDGVRRFPITGLSRSEVEQFLQLNNLEIAPGDVERLHTASKGNPLYLYYFTRYQISPLPEGLEEYHRVLWARLTPQQQELLNLIAHARLRPLTLMDLHKLLNAASAVTAAPMETKHILDAAMPLVRVVDGGYQLFHPYFEEHIRHMAGAEGTAAHYHSLLADYAIDNKQIVQAAFHLLRAGDPRVEDYLIQAALATVLRGDWALGEEFLAREIELS